MSLTWTEFNYLYRDADNHKAFGSIVFSETVDFERWEAARERFFDGSLFIAEQLGVPCLCHQLFRWSGGSPTDADHCWHEFLDLKLIGEDQLSDDVPRGGPIDSFVERLSCTEEWDILLSPNVAVSPPPLDDTL